MPSVRSLEQQQYYAHPRNRFWPVMGAIFGAGPDLAYPRRCARLTSAGVAVWDVLASCQRPGSLDTDIRRHSEQANPIDELVTDHSGIQRVLFNGQAAAKTFDRHVRDRLDAWPECLVLPSTSPANARWSLPQLIDVWRSALQPV